MSIAGQVRVDMIIFWASWHSYRIIFSVSKAAGACAVAVAMAGAVTCAVVGACI